MNTTHTPGPLESGPLFIHEMESGGIQPEFSIGAQDYRALDGGHIALATGISDRRVAVLFASAPDLLAALKEALPLIDDAAEEQRALAKGAATELFRDRHNHVANLLRNQARDARATIAKAEGAS